MIINDIHKRDITTIKISNTVIPLSNETIERIRKDYIEVMSKSVEDAICSLDWLFCYSLEELKRHCRIVKMIGLPNMEWFTFRDKKLFTIDYRAFPRVTVRFDNV